MFLPGQIENYVLILDATKLGITELPKDIKGWIKEIIGTVSVNYPFRMVHLFILNVSFFIRLLWTFAKSFLNDENKRKVNVSQGGVNERLISMCHPSQLIY